MLADFSDTLRLDPTRVQAYVQRAALLALAGDRSGGDGRVFSGNDGGCSACARAPWQDALFEACSQAVEQHGTGTRPDADNILAEFAIADCRFIVVPVRVGGKTLRMVVDTGSPGRSLRPVAPGFARPRDRQDEDQHSSGGHEGVSARPRHDELGYNRSGQHARFDSLRLNLRRTARRSARFQVDAILGMDVLSQFVFQARHFGPQGLSAEVMPCGCRCCRPNG